VIASVQARIVIRQSGGETTVAKVDERCSNIDKELSALKKALNIDWKYS